MRYFVDTEFVRFRIGGQKESFTITEWLSVGIVAEDGRELYLEHAVEFGDQEKRQFPDFVKKHVLAKIGDGISVKSFQACERILGFITDYPEFWGDCAAFDYTVLSQIMGTFEQWPKNWPFYVNDIQQMAADFRLTIPKTPADHNAHHALADARLVRDIFLDLCAQKGDPLG